MGRGPWCQRTAGLDPPYQDIELGLHRAAPLSARGAEGGAFVGHEKERWRVMRHSRQARRRVAALAAGIGAASMARRCQSPLKNRECFYPLANHVSRERVGRGSDRRRVRRDAGGSSRSALETVKRDQDGERVVQPETTEPAESGRPGRIPTHGEPESGAPARPVARVTPARAKRPQRQRRQRRQRRQQRPERRQRTAGQTTRPTGTEPAESDRSTTRPANAAFSPPSPPPPRSSSATATRSRSPCRSSCPCP